MTRRCFPGVSLRLAIGETNCGFDEGSLTFRGLLDIEWSMTINKRPVTCTLFKIMSSGPCGRFFVAHLSYGSKRVSMKEGGGRRGNGKGDGVKKALWASSKGR